VIRIIKLSQLTPTELAKLKRRSELDIDQAMAIARTVIDRIKETGDAGVIEYARKFDYAGATVENLRVTAEEFAEAQRLVNPDLRRAVEHSFKNIKTVHTDQIPPQMHLGEVGNVSNLLLLFLKRTRFIHCGTSYPQFQNTTKAPFVAL
jgi:histidinol dehydrogenase